LLTHKHNDCCSLHKQHNICITITSAQAVCAAVVLNTLQLATLAVLIQTKQLQDYETPAAAKFVTKCQSLTLVHTTKHLFLCSPTAHNLTEQISSTSLNSDNYHFHHKGKFLHIDQMKQQQLQFPIATESKKSKFLNLTESSSLTVCG
jgi:hypothetical protein